MKTVANWKAFAAVWKRQHGKIQQLTRENKNLRKLEIKALNDISYLLSRLNELDPR
jgi:hypothetical protein